MKLYDDYSRQILIKEDFKKILQVVISYLWRRAICEIPTNSLSKTFATLYQAVDKEDYVNSIIKAFVFKSILILTTLQKSGYFHIFKIISVK